MRTKFKKRQPGEPSFVIVVASAQTQKPPVLSNFVTLYSQSHGKNVVFAVVEGANIMFVSFGDVDFEKLNIKIIGQDKK